MVKHAPSLLRALLLLGALLPCIARGATHLQIAEAGTDSVRIAVLESTAPPHCSSDGNAFFDRKLKIRKSESHYIQPLDSEVGEEAVYLKAARMGGGVYMHLPYFLPAAACGNVVFEVTARHILWDGAWHAGSLTIPAAAVSDKSIFFTNEATPLIKEGRYFDAAIPAPILARLDPAFDRIIGFYRDVLHTDPMRGIGVVAAIVRNQGNYSGFGGDSLNIIRMSYDNPTPQQVATLDDIFPATFAHELSHKLQSERLFSQPLARHIVEGSADFIKIVVLHNAGLIDEQQAKGRVRKALAACEQLADPRSLREKARMNTLKFREPYDCGMAYYFTSYYSSGLDGEAYMAVLRRALSGRPNYGSERALCLYFEPGCRNMRLNGMIGAQPQSRLQAAWLRKQLDTRPLPRLAARTAANGSALKSP